MPSHAQVETVRAAAWSFVPPAASCCCTLLLHPAAAPCCCTLLQARTDTAMLKLQAQMRAQYVLVPPDHAEVLEQVPTAEVRQWCRQQRRRSSRGVPPPYGERIRAGGTEGNRSRYLYYAC